MENNDIIVNCVDPESFDIYNNDGNINKAFVSGIDIENKEEIEEAQNEENTNEFNFQECATKLRAVVIDDSEENRVKQATSFIDNEILNQPGSVNDMELFIESRIYTHFSFTKKGFINLVKSHCKDKLSSLKKIAKKENTIKEQAQKQDGITSLLDMDSVSGRNTAFHIIAKDYMRNHSVKYIGGLLRSYKNGVYSVSEETKGFMHKELMYLALRKYGTPLSKPHVESIVKVMEMCTPIKMEDCDKDKESVIIVNNGCLNLNTFELVEHSPDNVYFSKIPVDFDIDAKEPSMGSVAKKL